MGFMAPGSGNMYTSSISGSIAMTTTPTTASSTSGTITQGQIQSNQCQGNINADPASIHLPPTRPGLIWKSESALHYARRGLTSTGGLSERFYATGKRAAYRIQPVVSVMRRERNKELSP
ncbi:hypothetical protein DPEC_G00304500 [Dallia pectoralis]|uniref:Uncharacterized protein n=1 Tax=Dallia pectoralis TaxID=75939 RepID=A0ACC2FDI3_DALPE|nr:hypothetical protein DPEC_G00304500 [Dallia pectoralis]